jgi:HAD superfamily hydrolase (TIGR01509 family)
MIRALIFDLDGLILDTESLDFVAWQDIYRAHGCTLRFDIWLQTVGTPLDWPLLYDVLEEHLGRPVDRVAVRRSHQQRYARLSQAQPALPGVEPYLADARRLGLSIGLASNATRDWANGHLRRLGLAGYFDCIKSAEDVQHAKPAPDLYLAVLDGLSLRPDQALAFEDSISGVRAAKQAGLACVAVANAATRHLSLDQADVVLHSLTDKPLDELLGGLRQRGALR